MVSSKGKGERETYRTKCLYLKEKKSQWCKFSHQETSNRRPNSSKQKEGNNIDKESMKMKTEV